jgi:hypothetical protein
MVKRKFLRVLGFDSMVPIPLGMPVGMGAMLAHRKKAYRVEC